jgi:hypothetical protein
MLIHGSEWRFMVSRSGLRGEVVVVEAVVGLTDLSLTGSRGAVGVAKGGCTHEEVQGEEVVCGACGSGGKRRQRGSSRGPGDQSGSWRCRG